MSKGQGPPASSLFEGARADNTPGTAALDRLRGQLVPFQLYFFDSRASTSDTAADLAREGAAAPAVVVAGRQTAGRGQRGRLWFSGRESLAATFILPIHPDRPLPQLPILTGLAVREALAGLVGEIGLKVKWPNDVELHGRKVAGILCERKHGVDLVGVGINIRHDAQEVPTELADSIIALADACPNPPDRWSVLAAVAAAMRLRMLEASATKAWEWSQSDFPAHDALAGIAIDVETPQGRIAGQSGGIDDQGGLRVVTFEGETKVIVSGTVRRSP